MLRLIHSLSDFRAPESGYVATLGNFDGLHLGHQALIARVFECAQAQRCSALLIVFEPLPREYFSEKKQPRLTTLRERLEVLRSVYQIDTSPISVDVLCLRFNAQMAEYDAASFLKEVLVDQLHVHHLVVGDDFRFGKERSGDCSFLSEKGPDYGMTTECMPTIFVDAQRVSSRRIRMVLAQGDLAYAARLLGRFYTLHGRVIQGDARGRALGFPTANVSLKRSFSPIQGVFAVRVYGIEKQAVLGVANIGCRPTFDGTCVVLEVHLFDFDRMIYGQFITVEFVTKLRDERRFDHVGDLKTQIAKDIEDARASFDVNAHSTP